MLQTRKPAVAGMFYPADPEQLHEQVLGMLADARHTGIQPKAIIAPHAGYIYSGPVAASAYTALRALHDRVRTVILLGPSHRVYFRGLAVPAAENFLTPLGSIPVDQQLCQRLEENFAFIQCQPDAHLQEHSLEVHLPFLQEVLDDFQLVPLVVGDATPAQVEQAIDYLWGDEHTLIVVSSDLSHYHEYETARRMDRGTANAIESMDIKQLDGEHACGYLPVSGLLLAARRHGLAVKQVDLRNSGDTAGPRDQVVGYGAWLLYREPDPQPEFPAAVRRALKDLALASIRHGLSHGRPLPESQFRRIESWPTGNGAAFVTLKKHGKLRGCIGSLSAYRPLDVDIADNAFAAAFRDPRFEPLRSEELDDIDISLSVLSAPVPIEFTSEEDLLNKLRPGRDGLILTEGSHRGTFLPSVWEDCPEPVTFLRHLKLKAGLPQDYWSPAVKVERYETISW